MKTFQLKFSAILLSCLYTFGAVAQVGDCAFAQEILDKSSLNLIFDSSANQEDDYISNLCEGSTYDNFTESGTPNYWMKWTIHNSGTLNFNIYREIEDYDIDFIVFKVDDGSDPCGSLLPIRCMFSGVSAGAPSEPCIGATGLLDSEEDTFEDPGCSGGDNNYLMSLDGIEGETYYLLIIEYSQIDNLGVFIDFCGTALLGSTDTECIVNQVNRDEVVETIIYPNPSQSSFKIKSNVASGYIIRNVEGKIITSGQLSQGENEIEGNFSKGVYFFQQISKDGMQIYHCKMVKI